MHIAILLATYNGAPYLQEQLDSIERQTHIDWTVLASDDGSSDKTTIMIEAFASKVGMSKVQQVQGPQQGFASNFLSLVCHPNLTADAYAYCDQDDIWLDDKLARAARFLTAVPSDVPALYCSRTQYVDQENHPLGLSLPYARPAVFANALVQNIASGNTMVFNEAARKLLVQAGPEVDIDLHDWWTYMLVTGVGGKVLFDQTPSVRYRQHPNNLSLIHI